LYVNYAFRIQNGILTNIREVINNMIKQKIYEFKWSGLQFKLTYGEIPQRLLMIANTLIVRD